MQANPELQVFLQQCQNQVEATLDYWLPTASTTPDKLHTAMRYSALGGGKRIRPVLVYAAGKALGNDISHLNGPACAVELIHAYSLVHDDLPAMDDDDLRRGQPTCHKKFDEATAILVGDALQTLAFQVLCKDKTLEVSSKIRLEMIQTLAIASGSRGMAGGQALDLAAAGQELDLVQLENLHIHKTGALIRASIRLGTLASHQVDDKQAEKLDRYAKCIGLAFQVRDDILDIEGSTETLGKTQGKDQAQLKSTYPALLGLQGARDTAEQLRTDALDSLSSMGENADPLRWIANYIVGRNY
ncbi:(2E,6E)-farnesyl diphosphate synthase [hydrothermal vent metagenome]|uniref:(2E,6E)-farnesyl diphosphate synthase n=1 Tax=hydrothermal vent metagenome TaxID=652676 RepID=A0A3B1BHU4_9ZZZZ